MLSFQSIEIRQRFDYLSAFIVIIMLANLACPSLKYLLQRGFRSSGDVRRWNWVNEYIGNSIVEYPSCNAFFAKNVNRESQPKQNTGLQVVPRTWKCQWRANSLLRRGSWFKHTAASAELLEAENNPTRTVPSN